jgi:hypothetical protein
MAGMKRCADEHPHTFWGFSPSNQAEQLGFVHNLAIPEGE